jgi:hypothetical protein
VGLAQHFMQRPEHRPVRGGIDGVAQAPVSWHRPPTTLNTTISKLVNPAARCGGGPEAAATRFQCAASGEDWITAGPPGARRRQRAATPPG